MKKILVAFVLSAVEQPAAGAVRRYKPRPNLPGACRGTCLCRKAISPSAGVAELKLNSRSCRNWARVGIAWTGCRTCGQTAAYDSLVRLATRRGLKLLQFSFPSIPKGATNAEAEAASFRYGKAMARLTASQICIGNC